MTALFATDHTHQLGANRYWRIARDGDPVGLDLYSRHTARHYTYVAPGRIRSTNPGFCFQRAGWHRCGMTKGGHGRDRLVILERAA